MVSHPPWRKRGGRFSSGGARTKTSPGASRFGLGSMSSSSSVLTNVHPLRCPGMGHLRPTVGPLATAPSVARTSGRPAKGTVLAPALGLGARPCGDVAHEASVARPAGCVSGDALVPRAVSVRRLSGRSWWAGAARLLTPSAAVVGRVLSKLVVLPPAWCVGFAALRPPVDAAPRWLMTGARAKTGITTSGERRLALRTTMRSAAW